jgi:cyclohexanone monooxygenase
MVISIEQHVDWIADCLGHLESSGLDRIEASAEAEELWVRHVNELADATLYPRAQSWYVGANIPGKPRVFMPYVGGCGRYRRECEQVVESGYQGFVLGGGRSPGR